MNEKEKMLLGKIYDPNDEELLSLRVKAHKLSKDYNDTYDTDNEKRKEILDQLIPNKKEGLYLQGPIYFDYGVFTSFGKNCYANFNLTVLDVCKITIGDNVFMGPNVSILTPKHPFLSEERALYLSDKGYITDKEYGAPITIKDDCWIAGNVTILAGVTIGKGCVIGAGSVVVKDIPDNSFACGNPCVVKRKITKEDSIHLKKELF